MLEKCNGILIKIYNFVITRKIINKNTPICRKVRAILYHNICYRCRANFGNRNEDRLFYVIRSPKAELGLFGLYNYVVDELKAAEREKAEPVVDWQFYPNDYLLEDSCVGKENAWEYFFKPMSGVTLDEVYSSKRVIMSSGSYEGTLSETNDLMELKHSKKLIDKYIEMNDATKALFEREYSRLEMEKSRILGIKLRGTDFKETHPHGHAICPDVKLTIEVLEDCEKQWGKYDKIFVVTEDEEMFVAIKETLGDRMIYNDFARFESANGKWLNKLFADSIKDKYKMMLEYLISVYILSKCDGLIAPVVGATLGAMRIKGGYNNLHLIHIGNYD